MGRLLPLLRIENGFDSNADCLIRVKCSALFVFSRHLGGDGLRDSRQNTRTRLNHADADDGVQVRILWAPDKFDGSNVRHLAQGIE
jgi:hypothetical protein